VSDRNPTRAPLLLGTFLIGYGASLLLVAGFLLAWSLATGGAPDIAARGPWLLALFLPEFAFGVLLSNSVLSIYARHPDEWRISASMAVAGAGAAMVLLYFGGLPIAPIIRWAGVEAPAAQAIALTVGAACFALGLLVLYPALPVKRVMKWWGWSYALFFLAFIVLFDRWLRAEVAMEYERGYRTTADGDSYGIPIGQAIIALFFTQLVVTSLLYIVVGAIRRSQRTA
jgi:hypothetical protein